MVFWSFTREIRAMSEFSKEFENGSQLARSRVGINPEAFIWTPAATSEPNEESRQQSAGRQEAAFLALSVLPAPATESFLCGWMSVLANDNDPVLWACMEHPEFRKTWQERTDRSIPGTVEGMFVQSTLNIALLCAVSLLADPPAIAFLLEIGAESDGTEPSHDRPLWAHALLNAARITQDTTAARLLAEHAYSITEASAQSLIDEMLADALAKILAIDEQESAFWDENPGANDMPARLAALMDESQSDALDAVAQSLDNLREAQSLTRMMGGMGSRKGPPSSAEGGLSSKPRPPAA